MKTKLFYLLIFTFLYGCSENIEEIFVNEKIKSLFIEFCEEVSNNPYRDGRQIIISSDKLGTNGDYCISLDNTENYVSDDKFAHFRYKGFHVFVSENVPNYLIKIDNYSKKIKSSGGGAYPQEFVEMHICVEQDTVRVMRVNFKKNKSINEWQVID